MARKEPLLNFKTLFERDFIIIDGERYEIRNREELSILDYEVLNQQKQQLDAHNGKTDFVDEDFQDLERLTADTMKLIFVKIPDDVVARLSWLQRIQVVQCFTSPPPASIQSELMGAKPQPTTGVSM